MKFEDYEADAERINSQLDFTKIKSTEDYIEALDDLYPKEPLPKSFIKELSKTKRTKRKIEIQKDKIDLFKEAGGRDLKRDQKKTSRIVLTSIKKYKKVGARHSDLVGLDTRKTFGYLKIGSLKIRKKIDKSRTRIVKYPKSYYRLGKKVNIKVRDRVFIYDKKGKRLSIKGLFKNSKKLKKKKL